MFDEHYQNKNLKLDYAGYGEYLIDDKPNEEIGGAHYIFKFENNLGASVIKHVGSYGFSEDLWELAAIKFKDDDDWDLCHITEIDVDIEGSLTDEAVRNLLERIKNAA